MRAIFVLLVGICLLCSSCQVITHDYSGSKQITPGTQLTQPSGRVGHIAGSQKAMFLLFGLIPINDNSGATLADDLARNAFADNFDGKPNLQISEEATVLDVIVNAFVGFIFSMMTVEVEGDVHTFSAS